MITHRVEDGRCIAESTATNSQGCGNTQLEACISLLGTMEARQEQLIAMLTERETKSHVERYPDGTIKRTVYQ